MNDYTRELEKKLLNANSAIRILLVIVFILTIVILIIH